MKTINLTAFPVLTTEKLMLRQLSTDDKDDIFALRSDAEINKFLGREPSKTIEDATNFINKINDNFKNNNSVYWVISLTNTKTFVGTICLFDFISENNSCEIGYELMTKFQGQGIMKEAAEAVIKYAFDTLNFEKIVAFTHNKNEQSTNLLSKLNFVQSKEVNKENADFSIFSLISSNAKL